MYVSEGGGDLGGWDKNNLPCEAIQVYGGSSREGRHCGVIRMWITGRNYSFCGSTRLIRPSDVSTVGVGVIPPSLSATCHDYVQK